MRERSWLSDNARARERAVADSHDARSSAQTREAIAGLIDRNEAIHERECVNLNPATNVMSARAEAALSSKLGSRPSLGHAGEKYEMGLEAIEELEVITASLACQVFNADYAEIRVASGAMANLYAFMATCQPGDTIIVPPASIGGHVTHHTAGAAGLYGLNIVEAPIDAAHYTVDVAGLADLARSVNPALITIGSSLNLEPHPVAELRNVADEVGAKLLFDAAHLCGMFAGKAWPNPLAEGAHLMTMSTYKSLAGPAGGLLVTNDGPLAERIDAIAYPGLTANFDAGRSTALAYTLLDWVDHGEAYAAEMVATAAALADALTTALPVFFSSAGPTTSHQFAIEAERWGGGHAMALRLRGANILTCAIGLPTGEGLRIGTPEIVRWGMTAAHMAELAELIVGGLKDPGAVAAEVTVFRQPFSQLKFCS